MTDWTAIGLKVGLEIHQQLATSRKLFCSCPTSFAEPPSGREIMRTLRPVAGETGDVDAAARHESLARKEFVYQLSPMESCIVETDSEPPHDLNPEALRTALQVCLLLNCDIPQEIHVMRKTVIDGSATSGFQRTAIVGLNGRIETSFGAVGIQSVALEEDSAQILQRGGGRTVFGLNRLGIPLIEVSTAPDIRAPEQGRELAEKLGMLLRSVKVRRGLGTIRQDLNISVRGGERVEIKGVQELRAIPLLIQREAERHLLLLKKGRVLPEVRRAEPDGSTTFLRPLPGAARLYPETDCLPVRIPTSLLEEVRSHLPEPLEARRQKLAREAGIPTDVVAALEKAGKLDLFRDLVSHTTVRPPFIAALLLSYESEIRRKHPAAKPERITAADLRKIVEEVGKGSLPREAIPSLLADCALGKKPDLAAPAQPTDIAAEVAALLKERPGLTFGAYMGLLMARHKGRVAGEEIATTLRNMMG